MLDPQNFSVYANSSTEITIDVDPDDSITLAGAIIEWHAYEMALGLPVDGSLPVISKDNRVGGTVTADDDTQTLTIPLLPSDTVELLRNYYHECTVVDPSRGSLTIACGIMTVLGTENRPEEVTT